jgi:hypothetical protein
MWSCPAAFSAEDRREHIVRVHGHSVLGDVTVRAAMGFGKVRSITLPIAS